MTGRAMGFCAGYARPGFANAVPGRGMGPGAGFGGGFGRGRRFGRGFARGSQRRFPPAYAPPAPIDPADELEALTAQARDLQAELEAVNQRIEQLGQDQADA